jgi:hypothetical protein
MWVSDHPSSSDFAATGLDEDVGRAPAEVTRDFRIEASLVLRGYGNSPDLIHVLVLLAEGSSWVS